MKRDDQRRAHARAIALARPELRQSHAFIPVGERLPEIGREVEAWAQDDASGRGGAYRLPFPVIRTEAGWRNIRRDRELEVRIVGWNYPLQRPE